MTDKEVARLAKLNSTGGQGGGKVTLPVTSTAVSSPLAVEQQCSLLFGDYLPLVLHDLARTVGLPPCRATQVLTAGPRGRRQPGRRGGAEEAPARGGRRHFGRGRPARRGAPLPSLHALLGALLSRRRVFRSRSLHALHDRARVARARTRCHLQRPPYPPPFSCMYPSLLCPSDDPNPRHLLFTESAHIVARHNPGSLGPPLLATRVPTWLLLTLLHPPITSTVHRNVTHASIMFQSCNPESPSSRASRLQCIPQAQLDMSMLPRITPIGSWKAAPRASCDAHHPHSSPLALRD